MNSHLRGRLLEGASDHGESCLEPSAVLHWLPTQFRLLSPLCHPLPGFRTCPPPLRAAGRISFPTSGQLPAFAHACLTPGTPSPPSWAPLGLLCSFGGGGSARSVPAPPPAGSSLQSSVVPGDSPWSHGLFPRLLPQPECPEGRGCLLSEVILVFSAPSPGACGPPVPACHRVTGCSWVG